MPGFVRPGQHLNNSSQILQIVEPSLSSRYEHEQVNLHAQDELMPGEERKMPPQANIMSSGRDFRRRIPSGRMLLSQSIESEICLQEDVFDEGEDVINRQLPKNVNINGSIPNQNSHFNLGFSLDMEERQNVAIVKSIIG